MSKDEWKPVWWRDPHGMHVKAVVGPPSKTGKTVRIRAWFKYGGMVERCVNPKNLFPRSRDNETAENDLSLASEHGERAQG